MEINVYNLSIRMLVIQYTYIQAKHWHSVNIQQQKDICQNGANNNNRYFSKI